MTRTSEVFNLPTFTSNDIAILKQYFELSEKYYWKVNEELARQLAEHPLWGPILQMQTPEQRQAQEVRTLERQRAAIYEGNWDAYASDLIHQGISYARMNVSHADWYEILKLHKDLLIPHIRQDFAASADQAITFLAGLSKFTDYAMQIVATAYFQEQTNILRSSEERLNAELQKRISERTEELQNSTNDLDAFCYSVSHDLRTPLRAINGFTQILVEDYSESVSEEAKNAMNEIVENVRRMGQLIDDLLEFSRLGKQKIRKTNLDMNKLVGSVVAELSEGRTNHKVEFIIGSLEKMKGDRTMLRQVMKNIISNALKYSAKKDAAIIEIGCFAKDNNIVYSVKDNGAGFDMRFYDKLFGVFQRLHKVKEFEGTGVGLAIVHRIVQKHAGKIWAESKVGEGATFYVAFPSN